MKPELTIELLCKEAYAFSQTESRHHESAIFGITDGKAIGTYLEHKFQKYLLEKYRYQAGNSAKGIDFPDLNVDIKVTSIRQPQSSCPFKSAKQKIFGLGYSLLVFIYDKHDIPESQTGHLNILHTIFIDKSRTADYQTTKGLKEIVDKEGNIEDLLSFMRDRYLPADDITANQIAEELLQDNFEIGYLTISNALQWRLQYKRVIEKAGQVNGILRIL